MKIMRQFIFLILLAFSQVFAASSTPNSQIYFSYSYYYTWNDNDFTFRIAATEDRKKAELKNKARFIATIQELYGTYADSLLIGTFNEILNNSQKQFVLINFTFDRETGSLQEIQMPLPVMTQDFGPLCEFIVQHLPDIMRKYMEKFDELYITLSDDDYRQYIQHYNENISPSLKRTLSKKNNINEILFLTQNIYPIPEFKTGKELLDYICSFENYPIKANEDSGVFWKGFIK